MNRATFVVTLRTPWGTQFQATRVPLGSVAAVVDRWGREGRFIADPNMGPLEILLQPIGEEPIPPSAVAELETAELLDLERAIAREKSDRGLR